MEPSKRTFSSRSMTTNEAALMTIGAGQLYLSLGDPKSMTARLRSRLYYKSRWLC